MHLLSFLDFILSHHVWIEYQKKFQINLLPGRLSGTIYNCNHPLSPKEVQAYVVHENIVHNTHTDYFPIQKRGG